MTCWVRLNPERLSYHQEVKRRGPIANVVFTSTLSYLGGVFAVFFGSRELT
jgi:hypothetical protein